MHVIARCGWVAICWGLLQGSLIAAEGPPTRLKELEALANQVVRRGAVADTRTPLSAAPPSLPAPEGVDLLSEMGEWLHTGNQLDAFEMEEAGVLTTSRPAWINLYRTEGRDFTLAGEVRPGGAEGRRVRLDDLPDGFALFLREWDGVQRYQLDTRQVLVKRRQWKGDVLQEVDRIAELTPPARGQWIPFRVRVSAEGIEYSIGKQSVRIEGPLDIDGANKIAIAPGTALRHLRIHVRRGPNIASRIREGGGVSATLMSGGGNSDPPLARVEGSEGPRTEAPQLVNGGFETMADAKGPQDSSLRGAFGETMLAPGSEALVGWKISNGPITWRENGPSPASGRVVELGPRDGPACLSQSFPTLPGRHYEISFLACTGRDRFHFNRQVRVVAGDLDDVLECRVGENYERLTRTIRAASDRTEVRLCGVGDAGFGPMIDDVRIRLLPIP